MSQNTLLFNEDLQALSDQGIFTIGVGCGLKYTDRGFHSETSAILYELRSIEKISESDPVLDHFAWMMNMNNDHQSKKGGGYLRRQPYAVTWIMRQAYRLGHDPSEVGFTFTDEEVVRRGIHVIAVYLDVNRHPKNIDLGIRKQVMRTPAMQLLPAGAPNNPNKGPRNHQGPMTVSRYIRDMFVLGTPEDEMVQRAKWFVRVHDRAKERQTMAREQVDAGGFDTFTLSNYREVGTWVDSDDP